MGHASAAGTAGRPRIVLIAAMDRQRAIGKGNELPWHLPNDLRRFKSLTLGKPLLMGRKTAESLGRALPGRLNLVLSRKQSVPFEGMQAVASVDDAVALASAQHADELCVIGGGEIYELTLPRADMLRLTLVDTEVDGADTWFPAIDPERWTAQAATHHPADERHRFAMSFVDLVPALKSGA